MGIIEATAKAFSLLGGKFPSAQENLTTYEKEAFAIVKVFEKMYYVLWGVNPVIIYTDHRNVLFVFVP